MGAIADFPSVTGLGPRSQGATEAFELGFARLFDAEFPRLFRYLDRLGGDPDLAADLAQEAFVRLYRRGSLPDAPEAWLVTVAMNLFRNNRNTSRRRAHLLTSTRSAGAHADTTPDPLAALESGESARRVRAALDHLSDRDRQLLLLRAEGYSYEELADVLGVAAGSIGTLLSRARHAFKRELTDEA